MFFKTNDDVPFHPLVIAPVCKATWVKLLGAAAPGACIGRTWYERLLGAACPPLCLLVYDWWKRKVVLGRYSKADYLRYWDLQPTLKPTPLHPHPNAAKDRHAVVSAISVMLTRLGLGYYAFSPSSRELRFADRYFRDWFWPKDVVLKRHVDQPKPNDAIVLIDVDYYIDMNRLLEKGYPVILYTFLPEQAAKVTSEYSYRFEGNEVVYSVTGGLQQKHQLWDYDQEGVLLQANGRSVYYEIAKIRTGPDRGVVMFVPYYQATASLLSLGTTPLRRRKFSYFGLTILPNPLEPGDLSLALQGSHYYATVSLTREKILSILKRLNNSCLSKTAHVADIAQLLERQKWSSQTDSNVAATILVQLAQSLADKTIALPDSYIYADQGRAAGNAFSDPLVEFPALFPGRSPEAELDTINNRINVHKQDFAIDPQHRARYFRYAMEFAELLIPASIAHTGVPLTPEEVVISQEKPRQKEKHSRLLPFLTWSTRCNVKAFQKVETYPHPKPPRNISTVPYHHLMHMSRFTLSMKKQLKRHPAFGPGHTPAEIQRTVERLMSAPAMARDFSSFDGTVSHDLNQIVAVVCERWCNPNHWPKFHQLLQAEWKARGKTQHNVPYYINETRITGSPVTADHNTLVNMFVSYCIRRESGVQPKDCFPPGAIYYGDDSIEPLLDEHIQDRVVKQLGLKAKPEVIFPGQPLPFLGRYFSPLGSICDPWRTLRKLHLTSSDASALQAAANKAAGYIVTDGRTPIVGVWARRVLELAAQHSIVPNPDAMSGEEFFKIQRGSWPQANDMTELFVQQSSISLATIGEMEAALEHEDFLQSPLSVQLPNEPWVPQPQSSINGNQIAITDLSAYEQNSCLYEAVLKSGLRHPFLDGVTSAGDLRHKCQKFGVLVPILTHPAEEEHIVALARHLNIVIEIVSSKLPTSQRYGQGERVITIYHDGDHFHSRPNDVELARARLFTKFGENPKKFIASKFSSVKRGLSPRTPILEIGPAPGYFARHWTNPDRITLWHYIGPGALQLAQPVMKRYPQIHNFVEIEEVKIDKQVVIADIAPHAISSAINQSLLQYPLIDRLVGHWLSSPSPTLIAKWFFDGYPPRMDRIIAIRRRGLNPRNIECFLVYSKRPTSFDAKGAIESLQRAYVANSIMLCEHNGSEKATASGESPQQTASEAEKTDTSRSDSPDNFSGRFDTCSSGHTDQRSLSRHGSVCAVQSLRVGSCETTVVVNSNGPLRRVQVQTSFVSLDPDNVSRFDRSSRAVLGSLNQTETADDLHRSVRQLRCQNDPSIQPTSYAGAARKAQPPALVSVARERCERDPGHANFCGLSGFDTECQRDIAAGLLMAALHPGTPESIKAWHHLATALGVYPRPAATNPLRAPHRSDDRRRSSEPKDVRKRRVPRKNLPSRGRQCREHSRPRISPNDHRRARNSAGTTNSSSSNARGKTATPPTTNRKNRNVGRRPLPTGPPGGRDRHNR
uniref:RNA replicase n=1 Tax=Riboviria sp. TaxID=2585031 RepID=A0A8K1U4F9_9VIRU|nr:MAG: hypothetical protein 2 [Riboviria sp.]